MEEVLLTGGVENREGIKDEVRNATDVRDDVEEEAELKHLKTGFIDGQYG